MPEQKRRGRPKKLPEQKQPKRKKPKLVVSGAAFDSLKRGGRG